MIPILKTFFALICLAVLYPLSACAQGYVSDSGIVDTPRGKTDHKVIAPDVVKNITHCCGPDDCIYPEPCDGDFGTMEIEKVINFSGANGPQGAINPFRLNGTDSLLVSNKTLNNFVAEKVAYYLSGSTDLSLYENFAIADAAEGRLTVGHNHVIKRAEDQVRWVFTPSLQTDIANDFAAIFGNKKFSAGTGLSVKFTWLFAHGTHIGFKGTDARSFDEARMRYYCLQRAAIVESRRTCCRMECDDASRDDYRQKQAEKNLEDFYSFELEKLENMRAGQGYGSFFTHWVSIQAYAPLSNKSYSIASDTNYNFSDKKFYNWSAAINYGAVWENHFNILFYNLSCSVYQNNAIEAKDTAIVKYSKATYTPISLGNTTFLSGDAEDVFVGNYSSFISGAVEAQIASLWPIGNNNKFGVSVRVKQNIGSYNATNIVLGLPAFLQGQEKDKGVNVELQARWTDVGHSLPGNLTPEDHFSFGLSLALPFGSILK